MIAPDHNTKKVPVPISKPLITALYLVCLSAIRAKWNLGINYKVTISTLCWVGLNSFICLAYTCALCWVTKKKNTLVQATMCYQPVELNLISNIEDNTWPRGDPKCLFERWAIFHKWAQWTSEIILQHGKRHLVSPSSHVMFYLLCSTDEIPTHFTVITVCRKRHDLLYNLSNGDPSTWEDIMFSPESSPDISLLFIW